MSSKRHHVIDISLAIYDEPYRLKTGRDKLGTRVRVTRWDRGSRRVRDYYPGRGILKWMMGLACNYQFASFDMKGKKRVSIKNNYKPWKKDR